MGGLVLKVASRQPPLVSSLVACFPSAELRFIIMGMLRGGCRRGLMEAAQVTEKLAGGVFLQNGWRCVKKLCLQAPNDHFFNLFYSCLIKTTLKMNFICFDNVKTTEKVSSRLVSHISIETWGLFWFINCSRNVRNSAYIALTLKVGASEQYHCFSSKHFKPWSS